MKALYLPELHKIELRDIDPPSLTNDNEVIVKISSTTICGSDIHIIDGTIPTEPGFVLGHEYVGTVHEVGKKIKSFKVGDRVIGPPAPFCGECGPCKAGYVAHCVNGGIHGSGVTMGDIPGTHAEYTRVKHADNCMIKVPDHLSDEDVIFISDIAATGYTGITKTNLSEGETLLIFGCGPVGLCSLLTAKSKKPSKIIVVERSEKRLKKALDLGATHGILASENVNERIKEITNNRGADVVVDAVGLNITLEQGFDSLAIGGRFFLVGIPGSPVTIPPHHFYKNISFSMGLGDLTLIPEIMDSVKSGKLDLKPLVTHRMGLDSIIEAFDMFKNKPDEVLKIIIKP